MLHYNHLRERTTPGDKAPTYISMSCLWSEYHVLSERPLSGIADIWAKHLIVYMID